VWLFSFLIDELCLWLFSILFVLLVQLWVKKVRPHLDSLPSPFAPHELLMVTTAFSSRPFVSLAITVVRICRAPSLLTAAPWTSSTEPRGGSLGKDFPARVIHALAQEGFPGVCRGLPAPLPFGRTWDWTISSRPRKMVKMPKLKGVIPL
jgi:hypothetical protein